MKIGLINPPIFIKRFEGYEWSNNSFTIQHLGLGYIAGMLEHEGYTTDIIECPGENINVSELCELIDKKDYQIIGITTYFYNFYNVMRIVSRLKRHNKNIFIFLGGYLPTLSYAMVLDRIKEADCCVLGEGEYICVELVKALLNGRNWKDVKNIAYRENDIVRVSSCAEPISDLDELPFPKRVVLNKMFIPISTSRGCYGKCNFCGVREFYEKCSINSMRFRSPENVIEEIEQIQKKINPDVFLISDETFLSASKKRTQWLEQFCILIKRKKLNIKFQALARANDLILNKNLLQELKNIGLINIFIGIESFVQRQLDFYQKMTTVAQNEEAINILKKSGLKISMGLMLFDPYVTIDELLQNIYYLKKLECSNIVDEKQELFSIDGPVIAIPGTKLYSYLEDENLLKEGIDIKYEIQDPQAAICYQILGKWNECIKPISRMFYLIKMAEKYDLADYHSNLLKLKAEVMRFDLSFFEELCLKIKDGPLDFNYYLSIVKNWMPKAMTYKEQWDKVKNEMFGHIGEKMHD